MDQNSAQPIPAVQPSAVPPPPSPPLVNQPLHIPQSHSPFKRFLPLVGLIVLLLLGGASVLVYSLVKKNVKPQQVTEVVPTTIVRSAPVVVPTIPLVSPSATGAGTLTSRGKLAFIKDGNIYQSDLTTYSLSVKQSTPAADKVLWSSSGRFLSWRQSTQTGTPSGIQVFTGLQMIDISRGEDEGKQEIIDYTWGSNDTMAVIYKNTLYSIVSYDFASASAQSSSVFERETPIKQIVHINGQTFLLGGMDGISRLDEGSSSAQLLISTDKLQYIIPAPDKKKVLYSIGDAKKSDLYIMNVDGTENISLPSPKKIDMGKSTLSTSILNNGFISHAVWYPSGDKVLVGYHYLPTMPLAGVYSLKDYSFHAIGPFTLSLTDTFVDESTFIGSRVLPENGSPQWNIVEYDMSELPPTSLRMIPGGVSSTYWHEESVTESE